MNTPAPTAAVSATAHVPPALAPPLWNRVDEPWFDAPLAALSHAAWAPGSYLALDEAETGQFETAGDPTQWNVQAGHTAKLRARLQSHPHYQPPVPTDWLAPYGRFLGRPVLGSNMVLDGGVYLGRRPREALLVDSQLPGSLVGKAVRAWLGKQRPGLNQRLFAEAERLLAAFLPYRPEVVEALDAKGQLPDDQLVDLGVFIGAGGGVCRHQVLLLGVCLERAIAAGVLQGKVSLERRHVPGWFSHAWVEFRTPEDRVAILDAAHGRLGWYDQMGAGGQRLYAPRELLAAGAEPALQTNATR